MLEIKDVWKIFNAGTVNEKQALRGVSLTLNDGDFVTVIGGNGAGKSTMLNAVAGVWPIDAAVFPSTALISPACRSIRGLPSSAGCFRTP